MICQVWNLDNDTMLEECDTKLTAMERLNYYDSTEPMVNHGVFAGEVRDNKKVFIVQRYKKQYEKESKQ